jgi:hypothetical protein
VNLVKKYKRTAFTSRIIGFIVATGFLGLLAWYYNYDIAVFAGIALGIAFVSECIFFHPTKTLVSVITLIQLVVISVLSYIILTTLSATMGLYFSTVMQAFGIVAILIALIGNYVFSQGRYWKNVLFSYVIYDAVIFGFLISGLDISYIYFTIVGCAAIVAYIAIRKFVLVRREVPFDISSIPKQKTDTVLKKNLLSNDLALKETSLSEGSDRMFSLTNDKAIFSILPVSPNKYFDIIKNEAWLDQNIITGVFEEIINSSIESSKQVKINQKYLVPILYVTGKSKISKDILSLKIRAKRSPDKLLGKVYIVNDKGFAKLVKQYETDVRIPEKELIKVAL